MQPTTVCKRLSMVGRFDTTKLVNNFDGFGISTFSDIVCENCIYFSARGCKLGYR